MKSPKIQLTQKGKSEDFETFKRLFESQFKISDFKLRQKAMKETYEKLTGNKVGHSGVPKKNRKADPSEDRARDVEDHKG